MDNSKRLERRWDWRSLFPESVLRKGRELAPGMKFKRNPDEEGGGLGGIEGQQVSAKHLPCSVEDFSGSSSKVQIRCTCREFHSSHYKCKHVAAFLYVWEREVGPFAFTETDEQMERRLRRQEMQSQTIPVAEAIGMELAEDVYFQGFRDLGKLMVTRWNAKQAASFYEEAASALSVSLEYDAWDNQFLRSSLSMPDGETAELELTKKKYRYLTCSCGKGVHRSASSSMTACVHQTVLFYHLCRYLNEQDPGDETDANAAALIELLGRRWDRERSQAQAGPDEPAPKTGLAIIPNLAWNEGFLEVTFRLDLQNGRAPYVIKKVDEFLEALKTHDEYEFRGGATVDFSREGIHPDSMKWVSFMQRAVDYFRDVDREVHMIMTGYSEGEAEVRSPLSLARGGLMEYFYELAEGEEILMGSNRLTFSHVKPVVKLCIDPVLSENGAFLGAKIEGTMPRSMESGRAAYIVTDHHVSRSTPEDEDYLKPIRLLADAAGKIDATVGKKQFLGFYYRVLPRLKNSPFLEMTDNCREAVEGKLPPSPEFTFYLDKDGERIRCRITAAYGEERYPVPGKIEGKQMRDAFTEREIVNVVQKLFPQREGDFFFQEDDEETLYSLLTEGIPFLEEEGTVMASDEIEGIRIRKVPKANMSLMLRRESGMLNLELLAAEIDREELLGIYQSYVEKKRFYRLKSSDFVDLRKAETLEALEHFAESLDSSLEDLLTEGKLTVPQYKALYVQKLLEEHEEIISSRDRHYRQLIKSFKTISDSDFEVPPELASVLRPYQVYGFKWLRTLGASSFGGILADDMGLGKTLQVLAMLCAFAREEDPGPFLVVCPASLVYNWREEAARFLPNLPVYTVSGSLAERGEMLEELQAGGGRGCLFVTSYDLLRRDVFSYEGVSFEVIILDEAQYIKNNNAAVTRAVKTLQGAHRYALTGTPIENRLMELWSIFDFLMPGFLYGSAEFMSRFETPITRAHDEEKMKALADMTGPFILRRLKKDVLTDLPEKLEESLITVLEEEQRKFYDAQVLHMREMLEEAENPARERMRVLAELMRLRQICCDPRLIRDTYSGPSAKREALLDLVRSAVDGGHRLLVFSQFTSMFPLIEKDLRSEGFSYYELTGATPKEERIRLVKQFNEGTVPVFLISLKAGGTGLNLTGADMVVHFDPWWNLSAQNQATDRAYRIGQSRTVQVYKLIAAGTIEEKIVALQEEKKDLADAILNQETKNLMSFSKEELLELLS